MKLISKTEIYEYDISPLNVDILLDVPASQYNIEITFKDGKFQSVTNLFKPPYSEEMWKILSIINDKIQEIKKSYPIREDDRIIFE